MVEEEFAIWVGYLYFEEGEVFGSGGNVKLGSLSMSVFYNYHNKISQ